MGGVRVLVSYDLYLEMSGVFTKLHEKDRWSGNLILHFGKLKHAFGCQIAIKVFKESVKFCI